MQEFQFSYMTNKTKVTLDDTSLHAKIGPIMKKEILLAAIRFFYIKEYNDYKELIIRYDKNNGKVANQKFLFAYSENGAIELANALAQQYPEKDLRGKDPKEAMKMMKAGDTQKMGFYIALALMIVIPTIFFMPGLVHFFDGGHEFATVEEIIEGKNFSTHNLTLEGYVLNAGMWEQTTSSHRGSTTTSETNYFPLVESSWEEGDPIHVLLKAGEMSQAQIDDFVNETTFRGTMRTVWWEGPDSDVKEFFISEYEFELADDLVMFEVLEGRPDGFMFYIWIGIVGLMVIIFAVMWIKQKKVSRL